MEHAFGRLRPQGLLTAIMLLAAHLCGTWCFKMLTRWPHRWSFALQELATDLAQLALYGASAAQRLSTALLLSMRSRGRRHVCCGYRVAWLSLTTRMSC